jgi:single-strand DNA-binding protein
MNKVILTGNIVREPEARTTQAGIMSMTLDLAVQRRFADKQTGERKADFVRCVLWRQAAEYVSKYAAKGTKLGIEGRLEVRDYTDKDGKKHYVTEVQVDQVEILTPRASGAQTDAQTGFEVVSTDDTPLPF